MKRNLKRFFCSAAALIAVLGMAACSPSVEENKEDVKNTASNEKRASGAEAADEKTGKAEEEQSSEAVSESEESTQASADTEKKDEKNKNAEKDGDKGADNDKTESPAVFKVSDKLIQLEGPQAGDTVATIHTNMGDISVRLFPQYAPKAVENFTTHAKDGYYDGIIFHRVINNFMIQGGDPTGTGSGGESIWGDVFENEVTLDLRSFRGALCMANAGPNTNGSQFYIVQNPDIGDEMKNMYEQVRSMKDEVCFENEDGTVVTYGDIYSDAVIDEYINNGGYPSLDMSYTIFGQVYEGMDVVDKIAAVETNEKDKPLQDVVINSIDVSVYGG